MSEHAEIRRNLVAAAIHQNIDTAATFEDIADKVLKVLPGPGLFDEAVAWVMEELEKHARGSSEHFYHICEGCDDTCRCPYEGA